MVMQCTTYNSRLVLNLEYSRSAEWRAEERQDVKSTFTHSKSYALALLSWLCIKKIIFRWLCGESGCIHISAVAFSFTESQKSKSDSLEIGICFSSIFLVLATDALPGPCQLRWTAKRHQVRYIQRWEQVYLGMRTKKSILWACEMKSGSCVCWK